MKKKHLLYYLFIAASLCEPVKAQGIQAQSKEPTIAVEDAARHIGSLVKLNCCVYTSADDGQTLFIYMNTKRRARALMLTLTCESRKKTLTEMGIRRYLNRQIKQPLDTCITATGKIILYNCRLKMVISHASDVYLGADIKVQ